MPIVPPAPVRFSTTTCWPIERDITSPMRAGDEIDPAAGRERHDEAHRPVRPRRGGALRTHRADPGDGEPGSRRTLDETAARDHAHSFLP